MVLTVSWRYSEATFTVCNLQKGKTSICDVESLQIKGRETLNVTNGNPAITEMNFKNSKIVIMPELILNSFPSLMTVHLDHVKLKNVEDDPFKNLTKLKKLSIVNNEIEALSESSFTGLTNLEILSLSHNSLKAIDSKHFKHMRELKELNLDYNKLKKLSKTDLDYNTKLESISLAHNKDLKIDKKFFDKFTNLKSVDLTGNKCGKKRFVIANNNKKELEEALKHKVCSGAIKSVVSVLVMSVSVFITLFAIKY